MESKNTKNEKNEILDNLTIVTRDKSLKNVPPPPYIPAEFPTSTTEIASNPCVNEEKICLQKLQNLSLDANLENFETMENRKKNSKNGNKIKFRKK